MIPYTGTIYNIHTVIIYMHKVSIYYTNITLQSVYCIYTEASSGIVHILLHLCFPYTGTEPKTYIVPLLTELSVAVTLG